jgi:elongation factor Ts
MQVAAFNPLYVRKEDVPKDAIEKETEIIKAQLTGKPAAAIDKIIEGKLAKFFEDACLLEQPFVKDSSLKVKDVLTSMIAKIGENIVVRRFVRYQVGEEVR